MNININTFNKWADLGKDKSMAKNHEDSVNKMFDIMLDYNNVCHKCKVEKKTTFTECTSYL